MSMPRADDATRDLFRSLLPADGPVQVRPMFGNLAAFVNGHMFSGVFGSRVFVRLPEAQRATLLAVAGAEPFAPMEGRPMAEYVTLPEAWRAEPERARDWVERSLEWASTLPPKEPKPKKASKPKKL